MAARRPFGTSSRADSPDATFITEPLPASARLIAQPGAVLPGLDFETWEYGSCSGLGAHGIDEFEARKILFVAGDHDAIVRFPNGGKNHVQRAAWPSGSRPLGHQPRPDQSGLLIERENPAGKQRLWPFSSRKPALQLSALPSGRLLQRPKPDFCNGQRGDEHILVGLLRQPGDERLGRLRLGHVADDIRIKQVAGHRLTLRPSIRGRARLRSAPTKGERRSAARMPPFLAGSPEICRMEARISVASELLSASLRASERINSRSVESPRTSKRAIPR